MAHTESAQGDRPTKKATLTTDRKNKNVTFKKKKKQRTYSVIVDRKSAWSWPGHLASLERTLRRNGSFNKWVPPCPPAGPEWAATGKLGEIRAGSCGQPRVVRSQCRSLRTWFMPPTYDDTYTFITAKVSWDCASPPHPQLIAVRPPKREAKRGTGEKKQEPR
jgi:hypothetical protein